MRDVITDNMVHPVLYDRLNKKHYAVCGQYQNRQTDRSYLVLFADRADYYITIRGVYDHETGEIWTNEVNMSQVADTRTLSTSQLDVFRAHYMSYLIHEFVLAHRVVDTPLNRIVTKKKRKSSCQQSMDL